MVAIRDAGVGEFLHASTSEAAQTIRAAAAALLVEVGAVKAGTGVPVTLLGNKLSKYATISTIYRTLKSSPGFVPEYSHRGKLGYWFEYEALKPYARRQGEPHYPNDLAAIAIEIKGAPPVGATKPQEPLFSVEGKAPLRGSYLVPGRVIEPELYDEALKIVVDDLSEFRSRPHLERAISLLVGIYVNEFGEPTEELE